eukprot:442059-Hanusia_phi.AAC.1
MSAVSVPDLTRRAPPAAARSFAKPHDGSGPSLSVWDGRAALISSCCQLGLVSLLRRRSSETVRVI